MKKLIEAFRDFGLSEYEARVLLTLLAKGELTAKEISQLSGVPRTSVYEVVRNLTEKGIVEGSGKPMKFKSISSEELVNLFSRKIRENMDFLKKELPSIEETKREEIVKFYSGDVAFSTLKECVDNSTDEIILAASYLDPQIAEIVKGARCRVMVIAPNIDEFDDLGLSGSKLQLDTKLRSINVYHGMFLFDEREVAIYLRQGNNLRMMLGSGSFAEFYKIFLQSFVKQKIKDRKENRPSNSKYF